MPEYQFVSFGDNNSSNATKAARSHAIRTALHRRNAPAPSTDDDDAPASRSRPPQPALRGRFRMVAQDAVASRKGTPDVDKEQKQLVKWAVTSKHQVRDVYGR
jgi:hypothetical protein